MMKPMPIALYQGDDWASLITVNNCDGTPFDLTGYTVHAQIRQGPADQSWRISAAFTCAIVPVVAPAVPNQISMSLTAQQTQWLRNLNYQYDLQITSPADIVTTIVAGPVTVTPDVTRVRQPWTPAQIRAFEEASLLRLEYA